VRFRNETYFIIRNYPDFNYFWTAIFAFGQNVAEIDTFLNKIATEQGFSGAVLPAKDGRAG
jgi:hypothetical protein